MICAHAICIESKNIHILRIKLELFKILTVNNNVKLLLILEEKNKEKWLIFFACRQFLRPYFSKKYLQNTPSSKLYQAKASQSFLITFMLSNAVLLSCTGHVIRVRNLKLSNKTFFMIAARKKNRSIRFTILKLRKNNVKSKALKIAKKSCKKCVVNVGSNC